MAGPTVPLQRFSRGNLRAYECLAGGRFPHLGPEDRQVWESFLGAGVLEFRRAYYDVRLGAAARRQEVGADPDCELYAMLRCKRVDVVLELAVGYLVAEVKPVCSLSAVGQSLVYGDLFRAEFSPGSAVACGVVCDGVDPDVVPTCGRLGVQIWTPAGRQV